MSAVAQLYAGAFDVSRMTEVCASGYRAYPRFKLASPPQQLADPALLKGDMRHFNAGYGQVCHAFQGQVMRQISWECELPAGLYLFVPLCGGGVTGGAGHSIAWASRRGDQALPLIVHASQAPIPAWSEIHPGRYCSLSLHCDVTTFVSLVQGLQANGLDQQLIDNVMQRVGYPQVIQLPALMCAQLQSLFDAAWSPLEQALLTQKVTAELLLWVIRHARQAAAVAVAESASHRDLALVRRISRAIDEMPGADYSLESVAERFATNSTWLKQHWPKLTGSSLHQAVLLRRMTLARQLLLETAWPVARIAEQCGYAVASSFSRAFREQEQLSPRAWRLRQGIVAAS